MKKNHVADLEAVRHTTNKGSNMSWQIFEDETRDKLVTSLMTVSQNIDLPVISKLNTRCVSSAVSIKAAVLWYIYVRTQELNCNPPSHPGNLDHCHYFISGL